jgi:hypothetical protein
VTKSAATGPKVTREQRKADTLQARKEGTLTCRLDAEVRRRGPEAEEHEDSRPSAKAETAEARKKGELVPAGEGSPKPSK